MKYLLIIALAVYLVYTPVRAQTDDPTTLALERIEEARRTNADSLDLSSLGLSIIPPEIGQLTNLRILDLNYNTIRELPDELWQLTHLESLDLSHNGFHLSRLPVGIGQLANLHILDLGHNSIQGLPNTLWRLTHLEKLNLLSNELSNLPAGIGLLTHLRDLNLSGNLFTELPPEFWNLTALERLDLSCNPISHLPAQIGQLSQLKYFSSSVDVGQLPDEFWDLDLISLYAWTANGELLEELWQQTSLENLTLGGLNANGLSSGIGNLIHLRDLYLAGEFHTLPPEIGQLEHLENLRLESTVFTSFPTEIGHLHQLRSLLLYNSGLTTLPTSFGELIQLEELQLMSNQLTDLPDVWADLDHLKTLSLSNNRLSRLPPSMGEMASLVSLEVSHNQLTALPPELGGLATLETLDLSYNQIGELPPTIGGWTALKQLDLSNNRLQDLPSEIDQLGALEELELSENQLTALPHTIGDLVSLKRLSLAHNPLTQLPPELVGLSRLEWLSLVGTQVFDLPVMLGQMPSLVLLECADGSMRTTPLVIDAPYLPGVTYQDTLSPLAPASEALAFGVHGAIYVWNVSTNTVMHLETPDIKVGSLHSMAWSPQGSYLVTRFFPDTVTPDNVFDTFMIWNTATAQVTTKRIGPGVIMSWSPDETYLAYEIYISGHMAGSIYSLIICQGDGTGCRDAGHSPHYIEWMGIFYTTGPLFWLADDLLLINAGTYEHAAYYQVHADTLVWEPFTGQIPDTDTLEPTREEQAAGLLSPSGLWRASIPGKDNDRHFGTLWLVLENTATGEVFQLPLPAGTRDVNNIMWRPVPSK